MTRITEKILKVLVNNIGKNTDSNIEENKKFEYDKELKKEYAIKKYALFTIKEFKMHRKNSGRRPGLSIIVFLKYEKTEWLFSSN